MQEEQRKLIKILGRTSKEAPDVIFWSGSRYEMNVRASNLTVSLEADYGMQEQWIAVVVNGAPIARMPLARGLNTVPIFRNRNPLETKNVRIIKEVQAMPDDAKNYIRLVDLTTDGELVPLAATSLRLEFIGDSVTSGEGAVGARSENDWVAQLFSSYANYAYMTAEKLGADYQVLSQSGWGVYCGYDNDVRKSLPQYYEQVCGVLKEGGRGYFGSDEAYDFAKFTPDVVVISLGTNDNNASVSAPFKEPVSGQEYCLHRNAEGTDLDEKSGALLRSACVGFLRKIRSCNPNAYLLWTYGIFDNFLEGQLRAAIADYREESGDLRCGYCPLPAMTDETVGARSHPGYLAHRDAAEVLAAKIREVLGLE